MALDVVLTSGATTYRLKAESASLSLGRPVIQGPLPAGGNPLLIDLGSYLPRWTVDGIVFTATQSDGGVTIPSKNQLEDLVTDDWNNTITITISGEAYTAKVQEMRFTWTPARTDIYAYRLVLATLGRT